MPLDVIKSAFGIATVRASDGETSFMGQFGPHGPELYARAPDLWQLLDEALREHDARTDEPTPSQNLWADNAREMLKVTK